MRALKVVFWVWFSFVSDRCHRCLRTDDVEPALAVVFRQPKNPIRKPSQVKTKPTAWLLNRLAVSHPTERPTCKHTGETGEIGKQVRFLSQIAPIIRSTGVEEDEVRNHIGIEWCPSLPRQVAAPNSQMQ